MMRKQGVKLFFSREASIKTIWHLRLNCLIIKGWKSVVCIWWEHCPHNTDIFTAPSPNLGLECMAIRPCIRHLNGSPSQWVEIRLNFFFKPQAVVLALLKAWYQVRSKSWPCWGFLTKTSKILLVNQFHNWLNSTSTTWIKITLTDQLQLLVNSMATNLTSIYRS